MNAKQRKIADKMRARAELDGSAQLLRLATERRQFDEHTKRKEAEFDEHTKRKEAEFDEHTKRKEAEFDAKEAFYNLERKGLAEERANLKQYEADLDIAAKRIEKLRNNLKEDFQKEVENLNNVNLIREILLQLELDVDSTEIALNLRKQFNLLVPEW